MKKFIFQTDKADKKDQLCYHHSMRIDKYLKVSHIIKRRELAKRMLDSGFVTVNGKTAKPATEIRIGDEIAIVNPNGKSLTVVVKAVREHCPLSEVQTLYEVK